jgi:hypothetical protein
MYSVGTELATVETLPPGRVVQVQRFDSSYLYCVLIKTQAKHKSMPSRSDEEEMNAPDNVVQSAAVTSAGNGGAC